MSIGIVLIILASSFIHAWWNYMSKTIRSSAGLVWVVAVGTSIVYLPAAVWFFIFEPFEPNLINIGFLAVTAIIHLVYFLVLQHGYIKGDLSVVYPIARGSGPVFSTIGAVIFLNESLSLINTIGLMLVVSGVLLISGLFDKNKSGNTMIGVYYGVLSGFLIACYTLWDSYAVRYLALAPVLIDYVSHPFRIISLTPYALRNRDEIRRIWTDHRLKIILISILNPLPFIIILYVLKHAPIGAVAPMREMSIVIGVILGAKMLAEEHFKTRVAGAVLIIGGIFLIMNGAL